MKKLKLMTIIGTRPEIIRLSEVIKKADDNFEHILVHTGQNWAYELNKIFFEDLDLREPDIYLSAVGDTLGDTMGSIIAKSYKVLSDQKPDALLVLGDTNSALSTISAKRLKIPIFHMEAGNRCFDQNVPEEINRKLVDHVSDVNLPYTEHSRRYLLSEGFRREHIFVTGSPMPEVIAANKEKISASKVMDKLSLEKNKFILISAHREENIDNETCFNELVETINCTAETYQLPIIYSVHPRSKKFIEHRRVKFHKNVSELKPFNFSDYNALQMNSYVVLSDSGTLSEESAILNFPAVLIRTSTERPEAVERGNVVVGGIRSQGVMQSIAVTRNIFDHKQVANIPDDYRDLNVSDKVIKIIQAYTSIINQFIWFKT